jgi:hypothetical protein
MRPPSVDELVDAWCARDRELAFLAADRAAIEATREPRALVVEQVGGHAPHADLFRACAVLGRILVDCDASPSLASSMIDSAREVLPGLDADTARAARGALIEGFVAGRAEAACASAAARWEYPGCAVPLENATVAIAAGYPEDDEDALAGWAARVASEVARAGYRRALLAGSERARALLFDALELAGIKVRTTSPPGPVGRAR